MQVCVAFPLTAIHYNPWNADTPLFSKADIFFFGPTSTWTAQNSPHNADAHMSFHARFSATLDSTTGHHNSTGTHSTSLFLPTNSKGGLVVLNSTSTDCHTHWKYTRSLWNTDASVFRMHSSSTYGTHIGGDPLYLIWYILVYIFTSHTLSFLMYRYSTQLQEYQICTYLMCVLLLQHKEKPSALSTASYWKSKLLEYQPGWKNLWHTVANLQQVCSM